MKYSFMNLLPNFQGPTFSLYTGPQKAHSGFQYIYTEASYPRVFGDKAVMVNNVLELPSKY